MRDGGADDDAIFAALQVMQPIETLTRTNEPTAFRSRC
jgi:hypothetical protein